MTRYTNACSAYCQHPHRKTLLHLYKILCPLLQILLFIIGWTMVQADYTFQARTTVMLALIYGIVLFSLHHTYNGLDVGNARVTDLCLGQGLALVLCNALMVLISSLVLKTLPNLWIVLIVVLSQGLLTVIWCITANRFYVRFFPAQKTVVLHEDTLSLEALQELFEPNLHFDVIAKEDVMGCWSMQQPLQQQLLKADAVFLCGISAPLRNDLMKFCADNGISVYLRPKISDVIVNSSYRRFLFHVPVLVYDRSHHSIPYLFIKRTIDIIASSLGLLIASPVLLCVAIAIHREDHGPVFYRQKRLTRNGKVFEIIKFRSMRTDAEKDGVARLSSADDNRITRVGKFLRATRLDELPQLLNILRGDMTLVGPRPERPEIAQEYEETLPEFRMRLQVKAGLTGYAQINGKYNTTPYDKLQMDLMYISEMSLSLDVRLILQTLQIMLHKESTEGVSNGQTTALNSGKKSA